MNEDEVIHPFEEFDWSDDRQFVSYVGKAREEHPGKYVMTVRRDITYYDDDHMLAFGHEMKRYFIPFSLAYLVAGQKMFAANEEKSNVQNEIKSSLGLPTSGSWPTIQWNFQKEFDEYEKISRAAQNKDLK